MPRRTLRRTRKTRYLLYIPAIQKLAGLRDQPDTVAAIVAGTILEGALERQLAGHMRRMSAKEHNELFHSGPLRNLQPKIMLGQALNLFGANTTTEMKTLGEIRNAFAHTVKDITFETKTIRELCFRLNRCELRAPPFFATALVTGGVDTSPLSHDSARNMIKTSPKLRYLYSAPLLVFMLEGMPNDRPLRTRAPWPGFLS